jgi:hypothetical protein
MMVYTETILGSPAAECANFGICQVNSLTNEEWDLFQPRHLRHVKAQISVSTQIGWIRFTFPKSGMMRNCQELFFPSTGFRIDSLCVLPDHISTSLGLDTQIILPGVYALLLDDQEIVIEVKTETSVLEKSIKNNRFTHSSRQCMR